MWTSSEIKDQIAFALNSSLNSAASRQEPGASQTAILYLIRKHRLEGYLSPLLGRTSDPNMVLQYLALTLPYIQARQEKQVAYFSRIEQALQQSNISIVPIKSIAFALNSADAGSPRKFNDIDIVVSQRDLARVLLYVNSVGFKPDGLGDIEHQNNVIRNLGSLNFIHSHDHINIDIHTDASWRYFPGSLALEDLCSVNVVDKSVLHQRLLPNPVTHALVLLYAGTKDRWKRINSVIDYWMLIETLNAEEKREFLAMVEAMRLERFMVLVDQLQRALALPKSTLEISSVKCFREIEQISRRISLEWFSQHTSTSELPRIFDHLKLLSSIGDSCKYLTSRMMVLTEKDFRRGRTSPIRSRLERIGRFWTREMRMACFRSPNEPTESQILAIVRRCSFLLAYLGFKQS
jgi:hypothetical protein